MTRLGSLSVLGLALLQAGAGAGAGAAAGDGLRAGLWRVTNHPEINGAPGPQAQNMKCLRPADVADLAKTFSPVARTTNSECDMAEQDLTPQHLKWHLVCRGQLDMDVAGEYVFVSPERYTATIVSRSSIGIRLMQSSRVAIEAEWVGECQ